MNDATISRSTSFGEPSARALPRAVMIIGPNRPVLMSRTSSTCEWYIHITELPSIGPGPGARRHRPHVGVRPARRHAVVRLVLAAGAVVVRHALGALLVEHAVRMHAVRPVAVVPEHDADGVAHHARESAGRESRGAPTRPAAA